MAAPRQQPPTGNADERPSGLFVPRSAALWWGLQFAFFNPALALLLSSKFEASSGHVGLGIAVYNASGFVAALVIPLIADRRGEYLIPMTLSGVASAAMFAALLVSPSYWTAVFALAILGGPASVGSSLLFAHLRRMGLSSGAIINVRTLVSVAWVIGPPLAALIMSAFGVDGVLISIGIISIVATATSLLLHRLARVAPSPKPDESEEPVSSSSGDRWVALGVCLAFFLLQATNVVTVSITTLYAIQTLSIAASWGGIALGAAAILEIPALLLLARLTRRFALLSLAIGACFIGIAFYAGMALALGPISLLALQILNAAFFAVVTGVGLTLFQDLIHRPGLASGLFTNVRRAGSVASGVIISAGSLIGGYRGVFATCSCMVFVALVLLVAVWWRKHRVTGVVD